MRISRIYVAMILVCGLGVACFFGLPTLTAVCIVLTTIVCQVDWSADLASRRPQGGRSKSMLRRGSAAEVLVGSFQTMIGRPLARKFSWNDDGHLEIGSESPSAHGSNIMTDARWREVMAEYPKLKVTLDELIRLSLIHYIDSWYIFYVSPDDTSFREQIKMMFRHACAMLVAHACQVDAMDFLLETVTQKFVDHLRYFNTASKAIKQQQEARKGFAEDPLTAERKPSRRIAVTKSDIQDNAAAQRTKRRKELCEMYRSQCGDERFHFAATSEENALLWWKTTCTTLLDILLPHEAADAPLHSEAASAAGSAYYQSAHILVRELLAHKVLLPTWQWLNSADFINSQLMWCLEAYFPDKVEEVKSKEEIGKQLSEHLGRRPSLKELQARGVFNEHQDQGVSQPAGAEAGSSVSTDDQKQVSLDRNSLERTGSHGVAILSFDMVADEMSDGEIETSHVDGGEGRTADDSDDGAMYSEAVDEGGDQIDGDEDGQNAAGPDATTRLPSMRLKDLQSHGKAMKTTDLLRVLETERRHITSSPEDSEFAKYFAESETDVNFIRELTTRGVVTSVKVSGHQRQSTHAVYHIEFKFSNGNSGSANRRFRHFEALHKLLKDLYPDVYSKIQFHLPKKSSILTAKFSSKLLDARQKELSLYLEGLIKQPELGTCAELSAFLTPIEKDKERGDKFTALHELLLRSNALRGLLSNAGFVDNFLDGIKKRLSIHPSRALRLPTAADSADQSSGDVGNSNNFVDSDRLLVTHSLSAPDRSSTEMGSGPGTPPKRVRSEAAAQSDGSSRIASKSRPDQRSNSNLNAVDEASENTPVRDSDVSDRDTPTPGEDEAEIKRRASQRASEVFQKVKSNLPVILMVVEELFELEHQSWIKRQLFLLVRGVLDMGVGESTLKKLAPKIDAAFSEQPVVDTLAMLSASLFPYGDEPWPAPESAQSNTDDPLRRSTVGVTDSACNGFLMEDPTLWKLQQKLKAAIGDQLNILVGKNGVDKAVKKATEMLQHSQLNEHFMYTLVDCLLSILFPDRFSGVYTVQGKHHA